MAGICWALVSLLCLSCEFVIFINLLFIRQLSVSSKHEYEKIELSMKCTGET